MSRQARRGGAPPSGGPPRDVLAFSGCACLLRSATLRQTGGFDERFFAYCEDTDLSLRMLRAGWRIVAAPDARVRHYYSMTGGAYSLRKVFWVERNHFWVALKNFPAPLLLAVPPTTAWRYLLQAVAACRGNADLNRFLAQGGAAATLGALCRAHLSAWKGVPHALRRRNRVPRPTRPVPVARLLARRRMTVREVLFGAEPSRGGGT